MADKIIVSKSKVTNLFDSIRAKSGSTDLMSFDNAKENVDNLSNDLIEVEELPDVGEEGKIYKVTGIREAVPNFGLVEKIYFNTSMSSENVVRILDELSYSPDSTISLFEGGATDVFESGTSFEIVVAKNEDGYTIYDKVKCANEGGFSGGTGSNYIYFNTSQEIYDFMSTGAFMGWNPKFEYVTVNADNSLDGSQNEALKNIISITPFESKLYIYKNGEFIELNEGSGGEESTDMLQMLLNKYDGKRFFYYWPHSSLDGIENLDFSNISTTEEMFANASTLESIPNNKMNLQNVTTMYGIFNSCRELATPLELYTTSKLINLDNAFNGCWKLPSVVISDTSKLATCNYTFQNCSSLVSVSTLDMNDVGRAGSFFKGCTVLENLILKNIKMSITIGSGTTYGHLLTLDSLINTCKECIKQLSSKTLTIGSANLEKIANVYVKPATDDEFIIENGEKGEVVVCESTDDGAMTITAYMTLKNWTLA